MFLSYRTGRDEGQRVYSDTLGPLECRLNHNLARLKHNLASIKFFLLNHVEQKATQEMKHKLAENTE
jgi:hypothetical protein